MDVSAYAESLAIQLRKGFLVYCVLLVCAKQAQYTGDIIKQLSDSQHEWQESEQGPPRKYYSLTDQGAQLVDELKKRITMLNTSLKNLEKGAKR